MMSPETLIDALAGHATIAFSIRNEYRTGTQHWALYGNKDFLARLEVEYDDRVYIKEAYIGADVPWSTVKYLKARADIEIR